MTTEILQWEDAYTFEATTTIGVKIMNKIMQIRITPLSF